MVESQPSKLLVAGSIPVSRSTTRAGSRLPLPATKRADVAQLAERVLGKDEVTSSILVIGSIRLTLRFASGEPRGSLLAGHARHGECLERAKRVEEQVVANAAG